MLGHLNWKLKKLLMLSMIPLILFLALVILSLIVL